MRVAAMLLVFVLLAVTGSCLPFLHRGALTVSAAEATTGVAASRKVLIINSYHPGYVWTESLEDTIIRALEHQFPGIDIASEYLDWKRHPDQTSIESLIPMMRQRYLGRKLDLILTTDDAALSFALAHRSDIFGPVPVVYCGVAKANADTYLKDERNVTGVNENYDIDGTVQAIRHLYPDLKRLSLVYENSETGMPAAALAEKEMAARMPQVSVIHWNERPAEEIRKAANACKPGDAILFIAYNRDTTGLSLPMDQFSDMLFPDVKIPVFTIHDFVMGHHVLGGSVLDSTKHASRAAEFAIEVLEGTPADAIPRWDGETVTLLFDDAVMKQLNIREAELPQGAVVMNRPFSFFRTYRTLVLAVLGVMALLAALSAGLLTLFRKERRTAQALTDSHAHLLDANQLLTRTEIRLLEKNKELEQRQETIRRMAFYDDLTALPNRVMLRMEAERILGEAAETGARVAMCYVDLDNFKVINDTFGHPIGDEVLAEVARRLSQTASHTSILGRLGGDEFLMLMDVRQEDARAATFAAELLRCFDQPFELGTTVFHIRMSIGIAMYPQDGQGFYELMRSADAALYAAKGAGRSQFRFFSADMDAKIRDRFLLEDGLRQVLDNDELVLHFQPVHQACDGALMGFEALLRWQSPRFGLVMPNRFIPVAEETGLILPIGNWVLERACRFIRQMQDMGYEDVHVAVNVSVLQLLSGDFAECVALRLKESGIQPDRLVLEITESVLMESFNQHADTLRTLSDAGVVISLDDFGTGYSSLTYLRKLPIQVLKVDKSFIDDIHSAEDEVCHAGAIVALARQWGMRVVAEGVEAEYQRAYLVRFGCDMIQGYLFSRPIPEPEAMDYLKRFLLAETLDAEQA